MELAAETKLNTAQHYSPTSTPVLDVFRPLPPQTKDGLSAGEYFLVSSLVILGLVGLPSLRSIFESIFAAPASAAYWSLAVVLGAILVIAVTHEVGHLLAGMAAGFKVTQIRIGPVRLGKSSCNQEPYSGDVLTLGTCAFELRAKNLDDMDVNLRRHLLMLAAGGPAASLLLACALEAARAWGQPGFLVSFSMHFAALLSAILGIAALMPDINRYGNFSDGARLLMLLQRNEKAERWLSNIRCQVALNQGRHPRDWNHGCVARAAAVHDDSRDAFIARWLAYLWAAERQDITCATRYLEGALEVLGYATPVLRNHLFLEAAIFQAWFRDNPSKALFWVYRIRNKKLTRLQKQRLDIALLWAEGRLFDAWEKLSTGYLAQLLELPASPGRALAEESAAEWKRQMESRMLTRAWRSMYSLSRQLEPAALRAAFSPSESQKIASW
ncbi:MAG TPA: site-2 protease family protein [Candidatus Angelobacter sp.]|nr:site-2 protease family protein [Candidatus Angelobacter sp.]